MLSLRYIATTSALALILVDVAAGALIDPMLGGFGLQGALLAVITAVIALMVAEFARGIHPHCRPHSISAACCTASVSAG